MNGGKEKGINPYKTLPSLVAIFDFYNHDHKQIQSPVSPKSVDCSVVKHREHVYMYISSTYQNKSSSAHSD